MVPSPITAPCPHNFQSILLSTSYSTTAYISHLAHSTVRCGSSLHHTRKASYTQSKQERSKSVTQSSTPVSPGHSSGRSPPTLTRFSHRCLRPNKNCRIVPATSFTRYKGNGNSKGKESGEEGGEEEAATKILVWPVGADKAKVSAAAASTFLVRDLITTPCEDMGPQHLEVGARADGGRGVMHTYIHPYIQCMWLLVSSNLYVVAVVPRSTCLWSGSVCSSNCLEQRLWRSVCGTWTHISNDVPVGVQCPQRTVVAMFVAVV